MTQVKSIITKIDQKVILELSMGNCPFLLYPVYIDCLQKYNENTSDFIISISVESLCDISILRS